MAHEYDVIMHRSAVNGGICIRSVDETIPEHTPMLGEFGFRWDRDEHALVLPATLTRDQALASASRAVRALTDAHVWLVVDADLHDLPIPVPLPTALRAGEVLHASASHVAIRPHPHDQARVIDGLAQEGGVFDGLSHLMGMLLERAEDHPGPERDAITAALRTADGHLATAAAELDRASTRLATWEAPDPDSPAQIPVSERARAATSRITVKPPPERAPMVAYATGPASTPPATATRPPTR